MTMDAGSQLLFSRLLAMGSSSLLQYVSESFPWSADPAHAVLDSVQALAREERDEVARMTRWMQKKHLRLPLMGAYPSHFTNLNFVTLDYLLPKLVAEHQREIAAIESNLSLSSDEEIRTEVQGYLAMKRRHLQTLQELPASQMPAGAA